MGLRGPKPDPEKKNSRAHGNRKTGSTAYQQAQIRKLEAGEPQRPSWVTGKAAELWEEIVPVLVRNKMCHELDMHFLGAYCMDMAEFVRASEAIAQLPAKASAAQRKELRDQAQAAFARAERQGDKFGMNSKSRVAMGILLTTGAGTAGAPTGAPSAEAVTEIDKRRAWIVGGSKQS